jgi:bifunctional non-homologous end joining protein LigD
LMMPHLLHRPVALVRAPDGVGGPVFFQKHADGARIAGIDRLDPALDPGHAPLLAVASADGLLAAAQLNVIEFHTWNALADAIDKPDRMTFDLDPGEGVSWRSVQESAVLVRELLAQLGLASFVKTSGGKGLHVVTPLKRRHDFATVKAFSHAIVDHLAATIPQRFVAKSGPANRVGRIFVDYLRNGAGATTACAWSLRVRPGLGVSVPIGWEELDGIAGGDHWTIGTIDTRIDTGDAAWQGYAAAARTLTAAMKTLGFKP